MKDILKTKVFGISFFLSGFSMEFETIEELKKNLIEKWNASEMRIGIGVSGGPDSMVLLSILCSISDSEKLQDLSIFVLTIDHNIRKGGVSAGDSDFVIEWVEKQKRNKAPMQILAEKEVFPEGLVERTAVKRGKGIEEAARFLRYEAFENFAKKHDLNLFCTAHNKNDQLETLIQRFLQGASPFSSSGIQAERGLFFRPLLSISRDKIIKYAEKNKIPYRIDATNNETIYYRNKIRHCLIPFLNEHFMGWQTAVLHGAEKVEDVMSGAKALVESVDIRLKSKNEAEISIKEFTEFDNGIRIQLLYKAFVQIGVKNRIPYAAVKECAASLKMNAYGIYVRSSEKKLLISYNPQSESTVSRKMLAQNADLFNGFFMLIRECGRYALNKNLEIIVQNEKNDESFGPFAFPLVIRNRQSADKIRSADGSLKKVARIFSDWKVPEELRDEIPIIEAQNTVCAVLAGWCGYKDWLVPQQDSKNGVYISMRKL